MKDALDESEKAALLQAEFNNQVERFNMLLDRQIKKITIVTEKDSTYNLRYKDQQEDWVMYLFGTYLPDRATSIVNNRRDLIYRLADSYDIAVFAGVADNLKQLLTEITE